MKPVNCAVTGKPTKRMGGLFSTTLPIKDSTYQINVSVITDGKSRPVSEAGMVELIGKANFSDHTLPAEKEQPS